MASSLPQTSQLPWSELGHLLLRIAGTEGSSPPVLAAEDADSALLELSAALGFRAHRLTGSYQTLCRAVENGAILVRIPVADRPEPLLILSEVDRRRRVRVHQVAVDPDGTWLSESELEKLLGKVGWSLTTWLLLRSARPLEGLRSAAGAPSRSPASRLLALASIEREDLKAIVIFAAVVGLLSLATPIAVQALVNSIAFGTLLQPIVVLATILLAVLCFSGFLIVVETHVLEVLERRLFLKAAEDVSERLPRAAGAGAATPELVNRFFEVFALQKAANQLLLDGLDLVLKLGIGLLLLAVYHPLLLALDLVIVAGLSLILWMGKRGPEYARYKSKAKYRFVAWLQGVAAARDTFGHPSGERLAVQESEARAILYLSARAKYFRLVITQKIGLVSLQAIAGAGLLGLGGILVLQGRLTLGELVAAELILAATVSSFAKLGKQLGLYYEALASTDKLGQLLDAGLGPARSVAPAHAAGEEPTLVLSELALKDEGLGVHLEGLELQIRPGELVQIEDRDGGQAAGLFDAITGRLRPHSGRIELGELDLRQLSTEDVSRFVMLLRHTECFDGTIADHLWLGSDERDQRVGALVLDVLGLSERFDRLPERLETRLALVGGPLSEPERILLLIARTALLRPRLVLIDGLLDRLPSRMRTAALSVLRSPDVGASVLIRTELEEFGRLADRRLVIEEGRLEEVSP